MNDERIPLDMYAEVQREHQLGQWRERYPGELAAGIRIERLRERLHRTEQVVAALDERCHTAHVVLDRLRLHPELWEDEPNALDHGKAQLARVLRARKHAAASGERIRAELDEAQRRYQLGESPVGLAEGGES